MDAPSVSEVVEALCIFDEAMLNARSHALLMRERQGIASELAQLPAIFSESARLAREGAQSWDLKARANSGEFIAWAQQAVLEAYLELTESQLRVAAHMARSAPDAPTRAPFADMCAKNRHVANILRKALKEHRGPLQDERPYRRNVQEEGSEKDFRTQIEEAVRRAESSGSGIRQIVLSPIALRHLRDQGCFLDGRSDLRGHPVAVDLGWDAPAFVIETFDRVGLDEVMAPSATRDGSLPHA